MTAPPNSLVDRFRSTVLKAMCRCFGSPDMHFVMIAVEYRPVEEGADYDVNLNYAVITDVSGPAADTILAAAGRAAAARKTIKSKQRTARFN